MATYLPHEPLRHAGNPSHPVADNPIEDLGMRVPAKVAGACHPLDAPAPRQRSSDLTTLYNEARAVKDELAAIAAVMVQAGNGRLVDEHCIKKIGAAKEKIATKYNGETNRICDIVRFRGVHTSESALYAGVAAALDRFPGVFVLVHDRLVTPKSNGYSDFSLIARLSNGHLGEVQLHLEQMLAAADIEHEVYKSARLVQAGALGAQPALEAFFEGMSSAIYGIAQRAVREQRPLSEDDKHSMRHLAAAASLNVAAAVAETSRTRVRA